MQIAGNLAELNAKPAHKFDVTVHNPAYALGGINANNPIYTGQYTAKEIKELREKPGYLIGVEVKTPSPSFMQCETSTQIFLSPVSLPERHRYNVLVVFPEGEGRFEYDPEMISKQTVGLLAQHFEENVKGLTRKIVNAETENIPELISDWKQDLIFHQNCHEVCKMLFVDLQNEDLKAVLGKARP